MNQLRLQISTWCHALTLTERIGLLHKFSSNKSSMKIKANQAEIAKKKLKDWQSQAPFSTYSCFSERLAMDGITEDEFLYLLYDSVDLTQKHFLATPKWVEEFEQAFSSFKFSDKQGIKLLPEQEVAGFLYIIEPLIIQNYELLQKEINALMKTNTSLSLVSDNVFPTLFDNLINQLFEKLNRTMVLELHVAQLQGNLEGENSKERFQSFLQRLRQSEQAIALLNEYPVLAHQLKVCIDHWFVSNLEFFQHLCADWDEIKKTFSSHQEPGELIELKGNAGDSHQGGRSVIIAKFSSGLKVVYKPRSLAVDVHFQELLEWLNQRGNHPSFRTLKIIDRASYGWVEFIHFQSCSSREEVERFYQRQGGYLALLHTLEAIDFHNENLIAAGEHPILVDLETLFHPHQKYTTTTESESDLQASLSTYIDSVLRVQLLPQRVLSNAEYEGIDASGIGGRGSQLSPERIPYLENIGTDKMRVTRSRVQILAEQNQPTLKGIEVNGLDYTEAIVAGFTSIYRLLMQYRGELLSDNSPLTRFAEDEVRVVLRPTRFYGRLLTESFHPDVLRDALDRDRLFDKLWFGIKDNPALAKIISAERKQMWQGDIPMFTTHPNSCDLWSHADDKIVNFFEESGMSLVQRRLQQMSEEKCEQQLWFIRASLCALAIGEGQEEETQWPTYDLSNAPILVQDENLHDRLLAAARSVGDHLEFLALRGEEDAAWIGLSLVKEKYWSVVPLDWDFYNGTPGIVLFLAYLGKICQEERYTNLAQAGLKTFQRQLERGQEDTEIIGFSGLGGAIYTMTHLAVLWDRPDLLNDAEKIVNLLPTKIEKDEELDILGGSAGCIGSLLSLYSCRASQHILTIAIQCGDRLLSLAQSMEQKIGWVSKSIGETPLTGFSHGAAGIAWALLELAKLTKQERFRTAALSALAYERSFFIPEFGTWRDLRRKDNNFMTAWCHGAPGIGLARLRSLPHLDDAEIRAEINAALQKTLHHGFGYNHSICHGDLGNLELLLQASLIFDKPKWKTEVDRLSTIILESIDKHGWLCGVPLGVETPGLMVGLAGIGYELLRLAEPERIPSVLTLESPRRPTEIRGN